MPRIARVCAEGYPHHITQRGNNKEKTFFDDEDKRFYLDVLKRYRDKFKMKILAYCLMGNHVHILTVPEKETSLARGIGGTNLLYTQYINIKHRKHRKHRGKHRENIEHRGLDGGTLPIFFLTYIS